MHALVLQYQIAVVMIRGEARRVRAKVDGVRRGGVVSRSEGSEVRGDETVLGKTRRVEVTWGSFQRWLRR